MRHTDRIAHFIERKWPKSWLRLGLQFQMSIARAVAAGIYANIIGRFKRGFDKLGAYIIAGGSNQRS